MQRDIPAHPYPPFILDNNHQQICRVFWLAGLDPRSYVPMLAHGGFDNWSELAVHIYNDWKDVQNRANHWDPQVILMESNIKKLATLPLWIHCRIIYGDGDN
mmetsp:Transcript_4543/g.6935  ORF Transcript_4543/g.6935 Transcript_4543/m.6935 type:complete len:102 (-) Transcript_4543:324-629(-)